VKNGSVTEGLNQVHAEMNHKQGVVFHMAMLGSEQADAEYARDSQKLTGIWMNIEIVMGNPGVSQGYPNPYPSNPYPSKPIPVATGTGFDG
jgi:hypothetical protein